MNESYKKSSKVAVESCPIWSLEASNKVVEMLEQIMQGNKLLDKVASTNQHAGVKAGFAAETWHAETFNLEAILKGRPVRAFTDDFKGNHNLIKNDPVSDIVIMKGEQRVLTAQSKYYRTAEKTANAFRERNVETGKFKYEDNDIFLGPSDQLNDIKRSAQRDIDTQQHRPVVTEGATHVKNKAADRLKADGVESKALTKREAEHLGQGNTQGKQMHEKMQKEYLEKVTVQQSLKAAKNAAIITAVIAGTINSIEYINKAKKGEVSGDEAVVAILKNTTIAAGDSALKAGVATASVSTAARYLPNLFAGTLFRRSLNAGAVGGAAICAADLVQSIVMFSLGKISGKELEERAGKNVLQTGSAVTGAAIGTSIGAAGGPIGMLVGSLLGGLITSLATTIAIDNGIDKRFNEALSQTEELVSLGDVMKDSLIYLSRAQEFYANFEVGLFLSEKQFKYQLNEMDNQSSRLRDKLAKF